MRLQCVCVVVVAFCCVLPFAIVAGDFKAGTPAEKLMEQNRQRYENMPVELGKVQRTHPEVQAEDTQSMARERAYDAAEDVATKAQDWKMLHRIRQGRANNKRLSIEEELAEEQAGIEKLKKEAFERGGDPLDPMEKWKKAKEPTPFDLIEPRDYIDHHRILKKAADDYGISFEDKEILDGMLKDYTTKLFKAHFRKKEIDEGGYLPAKEQRDMLENFKREQRELHEDFFAIRAFVHGNDASASKRGATYAHKGLEYLWTTFNGDGSIPADKLQEFKQELDAHQEKLNTHLQSAESQWKRRRENKLSELDPSQAELADWHNEFIDLQMRMEKAAQRTDL